MLVAGAELDPDLRPKVGASDLVQDSLVEAHRDFPRFRGRTRADLLAWLRRVLRHNLADARRRFREAASRQLRQEEFLDRADAAGLRDRLVAGLPDPLDHTAAREEAEALARAVARLPADQRRVIELRHRDGLPFAGVADALGRSEEAARKLWLRAVRRLRAELGEGG
jgi:RNA polymerase sigma-70 factor (ECF subfamily)